jgi:glycerophosphoryl diester phosphodiesterase
VHVWTINDPRAMRRLVSAGVDGIVTDRSDEAQSAVHHRG